MRTSPFSDAARVLRPPRVTSIHFDLPGVNPDSVSLTVEQNVLTVRAERAAAQPGGAMAWTIRRSR